MALKHGRLSSAAETEGQRSHGKLSIATGHFGLDLRENSKHWSRVFGCHYEFYVRRNTDYPILTLLGLAPDQKTTYSVRLRL